LIIKWPSLAAKNEKFFEKKFYWIGHQILKKLRLSNQLYFFVKFGFTAKLFQNHSSVMQKQKGWEPLLSLIKNMLMKINQNRNTPNMDYTLWMYQLFSHFILKQATTISFLFFSPKKRNVIHALKKYFLDKTSIYNKKILQSTSRI